MKLRHIRIQDKNITLDFPNTEVHGGVAINHSAQAAEAALRILTDMSLGSALLLAAIFGKPIELVSGDPESLPVLFSYEVIE